jgi:hypothetical protein
MGLCSRLLWGVLGAVLGVLPDRLGSATWKGMLGVGNGGRPLSL